MKKLPIGIQSFSKMIEGGFVYLDKTELIYKLANTEACYFLSRPRRFGKSLTLSTLHEYFNGRKDLFVGTKMEQLEQKWDKYPVLHFDFNASSYKTVDDVISRISFMLSEYEDEYGRNPNASTNSERFQSLITTIAKKTGKKVVILVDEYDKPLLNNILNDNLKDKIRTVLKPFYGVLKTCDTQIKMAFVTGVTKFSKVSLFSDVNNMTDISNMLDYSTICGATEREIHDKLDEYVQRLADKEGLSKDDCYYKLRDWYGGYHFSPSSNEIFNPIGLTYALEQKHISYYWFENGTPSFLVKLIKKYNLDLETIDNYRCKHDELSIIPNFEINPAPILLLCGYYTIKGFDNDSYILGFPNCETAQELTNYILNLNYPKIGYDFISLASKVRSGNIDSFMKRLSALLADSSYEIVGEAEKYFQNVFYLIFKLLGFYSEVERNTSDGRMDAVVKTPQYIYVFEFKLDKPAQEALDQINSKDYPLPFTIDGRKLFKVGVSFSSDTRKVAEWVKE